MKPIGWSAFKHHALSERAVRDGSTVTRDLSRKCQNPRQQTFWAMRGYIDLPQFRQRRIQMDGEPHWWLERIRLAPSTHRWFLHLILSCRKCAACGRARSRLWAGRAEQEIKISVRTWFCTFTVAPEHRLRAAILAGRKGSDVHQEVASWFTKYMKRVRKEASARLRFLMVVEDHKDGFPHLHALVHEVAVDHAVSKRILQGQWPYGFSNVKLTGKGSARYVTKYISKQATARVRASLAYGQLT